MTPHRLPRVLFQSPPSRPYRLRVETRYSQQGFLTTVETRRSWITCCLTWVRAKVARRSATTTATATSRDSSFTPAVGRRLQGIRDSRTAGTRTTLGRTLPLGYALSEAEKLLAQLAAGRSAGGED